MDTQLKSLLYHREVDSLLAKDIESPIIALKM